MTVDSLLWESKRVEGTNYKEIKAKLEKGGVTEAVIIYKDLFDSIQIGCNKVKSFPWENEQEYEDLLQEAREHWIRIQGVYYKE